MSEQTPERTAADLTAGGSMTPAADLTASGSMTPAADLTASGSMTPAADPPSMLAGDADRERASQALTAAAVEGRLTLEEFSDRVGHVHASRTHGELARLTRDLPSAVPPREPGAAPARFRAFCSQLVRSGPWELPRRSSFRCICGTIVLDLSQARLAGPEVEIDVFNLFGTVTLMVPAGVDLSVEGGGMFASEIIEAPAVTPEPGAPRLRISIRGPGGTLHVRSSRAGD